MNRSGTTLTFALSSLAWALLVAGTAHSDGGGELAPEQRLACPSACWDACDELAAEADSADQNDLDGNPPPTSGGEFADMRPDGDVPCRTQSHQPALHTAAGESCDLGTKEETDSPVLAVTEEKIQQVAPCEQTADAPASADTLDDSYYAEDAYFDGSSPESIELAQLPVVVASDSDDQAEDSRMLHGFTDGNGLCGSSCVHDIEEHSCQNEALAENSCHVEETRTNIQADVAETDLIEEDGAAESHDREQYTERDWIGSCHESLSLRDAYGEEFYYEASTAEEVLTADSSELSTRSMFGEEMVTEEDTIETAVQAEQLEGDSAEESEYGYEYDSPYGSAESSSLDEELATDEDTFEMAAEAEELEGDWAEESEYEYDSEYDSAYGSAESSSPDEELATDEDTFEMAAEAEELESDLFHELECDFESEYESEYDPAYDLAQSSNVDEELVTEEETFEMSAQAEELRDLYGEEYESYNRHGDCGGLTFDDPRPSDAACAEEGLSEEFMVDEHAVFEEECEGSQAESSEAADEELREQNGSAGIWDPIDPVLPCDSEEVSIAERIGQHLARTANSTFGNFRVALSGLVRSWQRFAAKEIRAAARTAMPNDTQR